MSPADWLDTLSGDERQAWEEFVDHFRRDALQKIDESAFVMSLVPREAFDVKFAVELGAAIMLDKPLMAVVPADTPWDAVPFKLRQVADVIVPADVDTEAGREAIAEAMQELLER